MRLLHATIPSNCEIALFSDAHEGSRGISEDGLSSLMDWARAAPKSRRLCFLGDAVEAIMSDDKRYNPDATDDSRPAKQRASAVRRYSPCSKQILAWMAGNHESMLHRYGDLGQEIADGLGCQFGGTQCKLALDDKHGRVVKLHLFHGPRSARFSSNAKDYVQRQANMLASLRRVLEPLCTDCLVQAMGHTHKLMVAAPCPRLLMSDDGTKLCQAYLQPGLGDSEYIEPDRRWYVNTGSYLRGQAVGYETYAEDAGYAPIELGHAVITVADRKVVDVRRVVYNG